MRFFENGYRGAVVGKRNRQAIQRGTTSVLAAFVTDGTEPVPPEFLSVSSVQSVVNLPLRW